MEAFWELNLFGKAEGAEFCSEVDLDQNRRAPPKCWKHSVNLPFNINSPGQDWKLSSASFLTNTLTSPDNYLGQWFSAWSDFVLPILGHFCQCLEIFSVAATGWEGATGVQWVGAMDAAKHPAVHTKPDNKGLSAQTVHLAKLEKPWYKDFPLEAIPGVKNWGAIFIAHCEVSWLYLKKIKV